MKLRRVKQILKKKKINETKSWLFLKEINKIDKPLPRQTQE